VQRRRRRRGVLLARDGASVLCCGSLPVVYSDHDIDFKIDAFDPETTEQTK